MILRYLIYAAIIYFIYLVIKWAFRYGKRAGMRISEKKSFSKSGIKPDDIEDADFTEVKNDNAD